MRSLALTFLALVYIPVIQANASEPGQAPNDISSFTWGARVGFAATGTYLTDARIEGHKIKDYSQDTQVGNFASIQLRFNTRNFLVQSGIGLNMNKSTFIVDKNSWNPALESKDEITCSYSMISISVPIQAGYHIVNQPPYCMSVFTGPRFRYMPDKFYSINYSNTDPFTFSDSPTDIAVGWTAGVSIQIGRTFLDFEYEATINNISKPMVETSGANPAPDYKMNRRVSIFSFAFGIMF